MQWFLLFALFWLWCWELHPPPQTLYRFLIPYFPRIPLALMLEIIFKMHSKTRGYNSLIFYSLVFLFIDIRKKKVVIFTTKFVLFTFFRPIATNIATNISLRPFSRNWINDLSSNANVDVLNPNFFFFFFCQVLFVRAYF